MAGGRSAVHHNKCQRIHLGYPFGYAVVGIPYFGHEPLRQSVMVYLHPSMCWTEGLILAETLID